MQDRADGVHSSVDLREKARGNFFKRRNPQQLLKLGSTRLHLVLRARLSQLKAYRKEFANQCQVVALMLLPTTVSLVGGEPRSP